jgi:hypothetical protein
MMEQVERIQQMELRLDRASSVVMELSAALEKYNGVQDDISQLTEYYSSDEWKQDFAADEAGELPPSLRHGVLSEDALWNLLTDNKELTVRMLETVTAILKK